MTATTGQDAVRPRTAGKAGRWITDWRPEDASFWERGGARVARRNLVFSVFSEHVGFSVWSLWLVFVPTALGAGARLPYTFAVARFGGRNWTIVSASLLLVPTVAAAVALKPGVSYGTLLVLAALAGVGGGNFASSMANINSFYPQRLKGWALGLNAGGGNLGVAVVQLAGLAVLAAAGKGHPRILLGIYIPLVVLAALGAALFMDNIAHVRNEKRALRDASRDPQTWVIAFLYIGTFGSFIGFSFAFGQVLQDQFAAHFLTAGKVDPVKIAYLTFLGPLLGSLSRPFGGQLADRIGGARTTFFSFVLMTLAASVVLAASLQKSLALFYVGFIALFVLSGIGNGSTYKMIPAIFRSKGQLRVAAGADAGTAGHDARRMANAVIGIAGAVGAAGGVLVNIGFRQSFLASGTGDAAYIGFIAFYGICVCLTWLCYLRAATRRGLAGV